MVTKNPSTFGRDIKLNIKKSPFTVLILYLLQPRFFVGGLKTFVCLDIVPFVRAAAFAHASSPLFLLPLCPSRSLCLAARSVVQYGYVEGSPTSYSSLYSMRAADSVAVPCSHISFDLAVESIPFLDEGTGRPVGVSVAT